MTLVRNCQQTRHCSFDTYVNCVLANLLVCFKRLLFRKLVPSVMLGLEQVRRSLIVRLAVEKLPSDAALDAGDGVNTVGYLV